MPDKDTIEQVGAKWQAWCETLNADEQKAVAQWWGGMSGNDVKGYTENWWETPGAWSNAWSESWQWNEWSE